MVFRKGPVYAGVRYRQTDLQESDMRYDPHGPEVPLAGYFRPQRPTCGQAKPHGSLPRDIERSGQKTRRNKIAARQRAGPCF